MFELNYAMIIFLAYLQEAAHIGGLSGVGAAAGLSESRGESSALNQRAMLDSSCEERR
jgi:hypothetical protein